MSNAVVLTSNTAEFENYLSDTFSLRKNSEVCLSKAAMSVPVEIHQFATIPVIPSADRGNVAFTAAVDGLEHGISWTQIYNAYTALDLQDGFEPLNVDDFYSGEVDLPLSNFVIFKDANGDLKKRVEVSEMLAYAFEQKFKFYSVLPAPRLTPLNGQTNSSHQGNVVLDGAPFSIERVDPYKADVGIKFVYAPKKSVAYEAVCTGSNIWAESVSGANKVTITDDATDGCSLLAVGAGSAYAPNPIDPNGGYVMFKVGAQDNSSDFDFGFATLLSNDPAIEVTDADIRFGVKVITDGTGNISIKVKDNGATVPTADVAGVTAGDHFFLQIQRRNANDPIYTFAVYKNDSASSMSDALQIYESKVSCADPAALVPVYVAAAPGGKVTHLRYVKLGTDSTNMLLDYDAYNNPELVGTSIVYASPPSTYNNPPSAVRFFEQLGFALGGYYPNNVNGDYGTRNYADKINNFVYVHTTERRCFENVAVNVGAQSVADTLQEKVLPGGGKVLSYANKGSKVPRFLDVALRNMPVHSLAGNLAATGFSTASVTRDVCHIPTPAETLDATASFDLNLSYEPYNPVYRSLSNTEMYNVNQLQVSVGYKDFHTNEAKAIRNINGNLKVELHFRISKNRIV